MRLSIGEMAKTNNISIHTLRYYDKVNLLKPHETDPSSKYRYYDENDCFKLEKIKALKSIGISNEEIKTLLNGTLENSAHSLKKIKNELGEKIAALNEIADYLNDELLQIEEFTLGKCYLKPHIIFMDEREGYLIGVKEKHPLIERIKLIETFNERNNTNCSILLSPARLMNIDIAGNRHLKDYIGIKRSTTQNFPNENNLYVLDKGFYGVIDHIGINEDIKNSYNTLLQYIEKQNFTISGESIELLLINSDITSNPDERRTQIQIPINLKKE